MSNLAGKIGQVIKVQRAEIEKLTEEIRRLPEGCLYCNKKKVKAYYYHVYTTDNERKQRYLGTTYGKNAQLISDLKRKRFLLACIKVLEGNVVALRACLKKYVEFDPTQISSRMAASYENISDANASREGLDWQHSPYERAEMHPETLKHETIGGLLVRSKSEALIAFALDLADVPFHYEEILEIDGKKIAPDFTILHPLTGEKMFWEHFGLMDDPNYATETYRKLVLYGQNGIVPGRNLIFTMETNAEPLSTLEVQRMISKHLNA